MKKLVFSIFLIGALNARAFQDDGLPFESDTTAIKLGKIAHGTTVNLEFDMSLPVTQKLNKGAPSFVSIYEKKPRDKKWVEAQKIDLNTIMNFGDQFHFSKQIKLQHPDSEVAVFSTIYRCGKDHKTPCYIQGFKGVTSRSVASTTRSIPFYIAGKMR